MTQPLGNCPGCGGDEPFEQVHLGRHAGRENIDCIDCTECTEWMCPGCGAGVFMGMIPATTGAPARAAFRAA
jgi:hypothetical protein